MLDHLKKEHQGTAASLGRLSPLIVGLLVLGAVIAGIAEFGGGGSDSSEPVVRSAAEEEASPPKAPVIDPNRLPSGDGPAEHAHFQKEALTYLLGLVGYDYSAQAERMGADELAALPFADARGRVYEVEGTVKEITNQAYGPDGRERLWSLILEGAGEARLLIVKHALDSDELEGMPEEALKTSTEYFQPGDRLIVRGIYLQRRTGTWGDQIIREPVPVLLATPPLAAYRRLPTPAAPVADPAEVDWGEVKDRLLRDTQFWAEPALFQILQWARRTGYEKIRKNIRSGRYPVYDWDRDTFDRWSAEVEQADPAYERVATEEMRGRLFGTPGLLEAFVHHGWELVPRQASAWGIDHVYLLDVVSDHYGHMALRGFSAFPLETYTDVTGEKHQHVMIYGFFLKNYTYTSKKMRDGAEADVTMPMFVVVDIRALPPIESPYAKLIWVIAGVILVLAVLFYFVLVRGERKEAARMDAHRRELRRRARERAARRATTEDAADEP